MNYPIPEEVIFVYKTFQNAKFEVYFVGGCVRNMLMKKPVKDWDLTTNATPTEILMLFPNGFYDNMFGTVGVPIELKTESHLIEITTFRTEHGYSDKRRPDKVLWGKTIEEDLSRRDFTVNAIALNLKPKTHNLQPSIIDPFGGQKDIEQKLIKAVGDPALRFKEDALRLLRAIRLATVLGFTIEKNTWNEIIHDSELIEHIARERIAIELLKILDSNYPYEGIVLLKNSGLLARILPELLEGIGVSQVRPGRHHTTDVFQHNLLALKFCPSKDPIVRLATLIHDVGKPRVEGKDEEGLVVFHNHELVGSKMAETICDRLRLSKKEKQKITTLIRWHMFTVDEHTTDAAVRRFIRRVGIENIQDMIDLRIGDRLGSGTKTAESWRLKLFKKRVEEQLAPGPFSINDMAIDGSNVMKELGIKPGPKVGEILERLFAEVDEDLSKNNKEYLLRRIKELV